MSWNEFINEEKNKDYYKILEQKVEEAYKTSICYPSYENIFNAFNLTSTDDLKVVILGQDPYHEPNQAHGLSFSVLCEKLPPSLVNIYKEIIGKMDDLDKRVDRISKKIGKGETNSEIEQISIENSKLLNDLIKLQDDRIEELQKEALQG